MESVKSIENALDYLDSEGIAMHSLLAMKNDELISEVYYSPFNRESLHRMYSVTKSITAIGIGILEKKGLLSLNDSIIKYFPEYDTPSLDERIRETTIRDLLMMKSPFSFTVYKRGATPSNDCSKFHYDWINSFFTLTPDREPGTFFSYDTGSSVVLSKIIEIISGKEYMEFMREHFEISSSSYILRDPSKRAPQGGSGIMMRSIDLLKIVNVLTMGGKGLVREEFLNDATSALSSTFMMGLSNTKERRSGYGYQIWRVRDDAFAFIGLGGQYGLSLPEKGLSFVTTADTQVNDSQSSVILKTLLKIADEIDFDAKCEQKERAVISLKSTGSPLPWSGEYEFSSNDKGYKSLTLNIGKKEGSISFLKDGRGYNLPFSIGENKLSKLWEKSSSPALTSFAFNFDSTLSIWSQFIGPYNGGLTFEIASRDSAKTLSIRIRTYGELMFSSFGGVFSLKRVSSS